MKKVLIIILSIFTLLSCDTSSVDLSNENYVFDGRGGARCYVNGIEFVPRIVTSPGAVSAELQTYTSMGVDYLVLSFNKRGENNELLVVRTELKNVNPFQTDLTGTIIELNDINLGTYNILLLEEYSTNLDNLGEFEIVYHNQNERILAGKFWFNAVNINNEIKEIRNGQFDMKYH